MSELDVAYCAGIIDGEGCIRIKKVAWTRYRKDRQTPGYHACIAVKMVDRGPLDLLAEVFGGCIRHEKRQDANRRELFVWSITDKKAESACIALLPILRVKKRQAELVIRLRAMQNNSAAHRTKVVGERPFPNSHGTVRMVKTKCFSDEYIAVLEGLYLESRKLNAVGDAALA